MNFQELVSKMKEYIKVHDYSNALRIAYILRKNFPSHDAGYSGAAQVYLANNDYIKSEEVCNEGINNAGLYSGPYIIKSEIYMKQRDFLAALKFWTVVREKFPLIEAGWTRSVHAYMELNQLKEAEKLCLQAMDISQKFSGIFIAYADISMLKNDFTTALKRWQTVRLKFPKERLGYIRAAYICIYLKNYQAAENILKE